MESGFGVEKTGTLESGSGVGFEKNKTPGSESGDRVKKIITSMSESWIGVEKTQKPESEFGVGVGKTEPWSRSPKSKSKKLEHLNIYKYIYKQKYLYIHFLNSTSMRPPHFYERGYAYAKFMLEDVKE